MAYAVFLNFNMYFPDDTNMNFVYLHFITPIYNFIDDRLADKLTVLKPLS